MFGLFGYIRFVRGKVEQVSSSPEFPDVVIFQGKFCLGCGFIIASETQGCEFYFSDFRKMVSVVVIMLAVPGSSEQVESGITLAIYQGGI